MMTEQIESPLGPKTWTDERGMEWKIRFERGLILLGNIESVFAIVREGFGTAPARMTVKLGLGTEVFSRSSNHESCEEALKHLRTELDALIQSTRESIFRLVDTIDAVAETYGTDLTSCNAATRSARSVG